jgi:hypothetical protein
MPLRVIGPFFDPIDDQVPRIMIDQVERHARKIARHKILVLPSRAMATPPLGDVFPLGGAFPKSPLPKLTVAV